MEALEAKTRADNANGHGNGNGSAEASGVVVGSGPGAAFLHETDVRLCAAAEAWRHAALRRSHAFMTRVTWLALSPAGRRLHRTASSVAAAASATTLPLAVTTPSQLEAEVDRLCAHFALDAGRGLHSFRFQLNLSSSVHRSTQLNS